MNFDYLIIYDSDKNITKRGKYFKLFFLLTLQNIKLKVKVAKAGITNKNQT